MAKVELGLVPDPDPIPLKRLGEINREVLAEIGATDALTKKIHESFMDFAAKATHYQGAFEEVMLRQRRLVWEG